VRVCVSIWNRKNILQWINRLVAVARVRNRNAFISRTKIMPSVEQDVALDFAANRSFSLLPKRLKLVEYLIACHNNRQDVLIIRESVTRIRHIGWFHLFICLFTFQIRKIVAHDSSHSVSWIAHEKYRPRAYVTYSFRVSKQLLLYNLWTDIDAFALYFFEMIDTVRYNFMYSVPVHKKKKINFSVPFRYKSYLKVPNFLNSIWFLISYTKRIRFLTRLR